MAVDAAQRFKRAHPCPVCGGGDDMPRGKGRRCSGFLSADGRYAHCTREQEAGTLELDQSTDPPSYLHFLEGDCRCGKQHGPPRNGPRREIAETYPYLDESGELLFEAVRFTPKGFSQRRPDGNGGWHWNLRGVRRVLYRLPDLLAAVSVGERVYVVEGEKDVHAVERAGGVATCNPMGAGKWRDEYAPLFVGADVIVIADDDEAGRAHARAVAASLHRAGALVDIRLPAEGGDVAEHLARGLPLSALIPFAVGFDVEQLTETEAAREQADGWTRIDLADDLYAVPPDPPAILGLLYASRRHVLSGPPESAKTLIAYLLLLAALRDGHPVAVIDFEMGPVAARRLLAELGATLDEIRAIYYVAPDTPPPDELAAILASGAEYVLLDAAIGAYDASGLDDNARKDAERFARTWITPLWIAGRSTVVVDHVTKNVDARGKFTIGSERKLGAADVHLGLEALKTLSRGGSGLVKVHVHKDRPGFLPRPTACVIELRSDPATHLIEWTMRETPHDDSAGERFRPTHLMEKVSRWLEARPDGSSRNEVERNVTGKAEYVRAALDVLTDEGHLVESAGAKRARIVTVAKPYREASDEFVPSSSQFVPDEVGGSSSRSSPPYGGTNLPTDEQTRFSSSREDGDDGIPF